MPAAASFTPSQFAEQRKEEDEEENGIKKWSIFKIWRYRAQFKSMIAAYIVFIASGIRFGWSVFDTPTGKFLNNNNTHHLMISWFLGATLGALIATTFIRSTSKNIAFSTSGFVLLSAGILNLVLPQNFIAVCFSSIAVGIAFGLTHMQSQISAAERGHKDIRGFLVSSERIFVWLGICIQLLYTRVWYALEEENNKVNELHIDELHSILLATLGVIVVICTLAIDTESQLLQLHNTQQQQEKDNKNVEITQAWLQDTVADVADFAADDDDERTVTTLYTNSINTTVQKREHYRLNINEADTDSNDIKKRKYLYLYLALFKIFLLRCFGTLAYSLPFNRAFLTVSWHGFQCEMNCLYWLPICGLLGSIFGAFLIDIQGRRKLCSLSLFIAGISIFLVGGGFEHLEASHKIFYDIDLDMIAGFQLIFAFVVCCGVSVPAYVYTAEAFYPTTKPYCIAGIFVGEKIIQLLLIIITINVTFQNSLFFFIIGGISLILGLMVYCFMPETKHLTLYECVKKFKTIP